MAGYAIKGAPVDVVFPTLSQLVLHYATVQHGILGQQLLLTQHDIADLKASFADNSKKKSDNISQQSGHIVNSSMIDSTPVEQREDISKLQAEKEKTESILKEEEAKLEALIAQEASEKEELQNELADLQTLRNEKAALQTEVEKHRKELKKLAAARTQVRRAVTAAQKSQARARANYEKIHLHARRAGNHAPNEQVRNNRMRSIETELKEARARLESVINHVFRIRLSALTID